MDTYFNLNEFFGAFPPLLSKLPYTLGIVLVTLIIALILGTLLTVLYRTRKPVLMALVTAYVWLLRGTPLLLLLFISYYGIPLALESMGVVIDSSDPLIYAVVAFSMSLAAFYEEVMRAAFDAIDQGQAEAAQSLAIPKFAYYQRILIPQAIINSLPNLGNLIITAIKQSSILFTIGIMDMYEKANTLAADSYGLWQLEIFLALMLIYWGLAVIVDKAVDLAYHANRRKAA